MPKKNQPLISELQFYHRFIENVGVVMLLVDSENNKISACSKKAASFYGFKPIELLGEDINTLLVNDINQFGYKGFLSDNTQNLSRKIQHKTSTGKIINVDESISEVKINGKTYWQHVIHDLGKGSRADNLLKQNVLFFDKLFRGNSLPIILIDPVNLKIIDLNKQAEDFFGLPLGQILGSDFTDFSTLPKERFEQSLRSFFEKGYTGLELPVLTKSKGVRDVEFHYTFTEFQNKNVLLYILVDVTERNDAIEALQGIKNNLAQEVKKQTSDLLRINNSLIDQMNIRRTAEEELRHSQEMFQSLFEQNPNGMILSCINDRSIVQVNRSFLEIFGFSEADVSKKQIEDLNIICDIPTYGSLRDKLHTSCKVHKVPLTLMSKQGHVRFAMYSGDIIELQKGAFILEVFHDVTENEITRQKLTESEERYRGMFNNALVGIYRAELSTGVVLNSNLQFAKMLGYRSANEIIGKSILGHFTDASLRDNFFDQLRVKKTAVLEFELKSISNLSLWVVNYTSINAMEGYSDGVVVDISDRRIMENLLARSENRFRSLIENASDIIIIINNNGDIKYLSPSIEKELGYSASYNHNPNIFDFLFAEDINRLRTIMQTKSIGRAYHEIRVMHKNGTVKYFEFTLMDMTSDPSIGGIIINARDISEQKKARDEVSQALLREQELSRQKTQFISTVSHEFRTPLTNISLNIQLLSKYISENKLANAGQGLLRMNNAVKRLTSLLNEISLISKDQSGRLQFTPEEWDSTELIDSLLDQISYLVQPNVTIEVDRGKEKLIEVDKNLLTHIITNLLGNAVKYSPQKGEIVLRIDASKVNSLKIYVKDNGIGIPESEVDFLFDPYFRASNVEKITGSGLGLSIVKRCVELHGGDLKINSKEGEGTEVVCVVSLNGKVLGH